MNPGTSEPRQVPGDSSPRGGRRLNKRRRYDQNGEGDANYPQEKAAIEPFECPFCKDDPHHYQECRGLRLTRLYDVIQHIKRQHLLDEVTLESQADLPENIILYCPRCRCLFRGIGASSQLRVHLNQDVDCQPVSIGESGFMISKEFNELKKELSKERSDHEKWFIIWNKCYPGKRRPKSPRVEISVPRLEVESILQDVLQSVPGIRQEEVPSIIERCADRFYKTERGHRDSSSVPLQAHQNIAQTTYTPNYDNPACMPPTPAFPSQPSQPQTQGFDYSSDLPHTGVDATPIASQIDISIPWNHDTFTNYSAPSPVPGFRAHAISENSNVDPGYHTAPGSIHPSDPYVGYPTGSLGSTTQDDDYFNVYGNPVNRRGSQY
ncbi:hypothetical protein F52700_423 [Fusarium sp. NRRL 52700]|nr:hypothetical protein F52700_423 [Fusarium sp. NRRL 52700]